MKNTDVLREQPTDIGVPVAELRAWRKQYGVSAGITRRGDFDNPFDLKIGSEELESDSWRGFKRSFKSGFPRLVLARQVHKADVVWHPSMKPPDGLIGDADGHATRQSGLLMCVTVADCVPVFIFHPQTGSMALLHAGWRGIVCGILESGVNTLVRSVGLEPDQLVVHFGPSIDGDNYEVSPEVSTALGLPTPKTPTSVNLREVLAERARKLGIWKITQSPWSTFVDSVHFFSHRRDRDRAGRMVAYLGRPLT
ncbi:MAG: polyphenol oxidase family protein [Gemmatimonadota bacterium]|nr:polyphenol oxidase family protein [Gemmatimonadota bacterium]